MCRCPGIYEVVNMEGKKESSEVKSCINRRIIKKDDSRVLRI
jgi:hypothetical protein